MLCARRAACALGAIAIGVLVWVSACATAPAATLPPDLAALEQQMAQLQANSERFSFQEEVSLGELFGSGIPLVLMVAGKGEASDSPPQATAVGGLFGEAEVQTRTIGETTYTYQRQAAELDGGRPWVISQHKAKGAESNGLDLGGVLESDEAGKQGTFSELIEELNGAVSVEESGPVTVDEQRVIEFDATLNPAPLLAQLKAQAKEPKHPLQSLELPPVGGAKKPAKPAPPPSLQMEIFIAPNGLPVRIRVTFADEGVSVAIRVDTLAINVPVHVLAPPAAKTVTEARLKQIERRHAARELKKALRACRRLHGKAASRCRAVAKLESQEPKSSSPPL